ncbi:MAG TPA: methyltransferase [Vicinamibacterales bacterium]|nr:methyltransferase [Vicinamibacterales bacterium]
MSQAAAAAATFSRSSTNRLTRHDLGRFEGDSLFAMLGRAVCDAGCLPRKEFFEAWEMARRVRRRFRGGRVVDLAGGHGLLAHALLILDDSSPAALVVDRALPPSAARLHASLVAAWPRLRDRVAYAAVDLESAVLERGDLIVSCHACGRLTDQVLDLTVRARARVAVLPCCHDERDAPAMLDGWMDAALALDVERAQRLARADYEVWTHVIPSDITPKNRLLLGRPV